METSNGLMDISKIRFDSICDTHILFYNFIGLHITLKEEEYKVRHKVVGYVMLQGERMYFTGCRLDNGVCIFPYCSTDMQIPLSGHIYGTHGFHIDEFVSRYAKELALGDKKLSITDYLDMVRVPITFYGNPHIGDGLKFLYIEYFYSLRFKPKLYSFYSSDLTLICQTDKIKIPRGRKLIDE